MVLWKSKHKINEENNENDLKGSASMNTQSLSGTFNGIPNPNGRVSPASAFISNSFVREDLSNISSSSELINGYVNASKNNILLMNLVKWHKDWVLSRYNWIVSESDFEKFCPYVLENESFMQGALAVIKVEEKFYFLPFTVDTYDLQMYPKKITLIKPQGFNGALKLKRKVNDDAVIFTPNYEGYWKTPFSFGKLWKFFSHYEDIVEIYQEVKNNFKLTRERLLINGSSSDDQTIIQLVRQLHDGNPIITMDKNSIDVSVFKGFTEKGGVVSFEDRSQSMREQFKWFVDLIKAFESAPTNASPYKKERNNTAEVESDDRFNKSGLLNDLKLREEFIYWMKKVYQIDLKIELNELGEENDLSNDNDKEDKGNGEVNDNGY